MAFCIAFLKPSELHAHVFIINSPVDWNDIILHKVGAVFNQLVYLIVSQIRAETDNSIPFISLV